MKRKDMDANVWYAIDAEYATRAGRIIDPGTPPGKVLVVVHRQVYAGGDRDTVGPRTAWLADITDGALVDAAIAFDRTGRNAGPLEALYVGTGNVLCPWDDYCEAMFDRQDRQRAETLQREADTRARRLAFAARWRAVAHLVDAAHPAPRHTVSGSFPESEMMARLFEYDEYGRTSHISITDGHYTSLLDVYESWAADRAALNERIHRVTDSIHGRCPDNGTCHHGCETVADCFRVRCCDPLSGVFPDDEWPTDVRPITAAEDGTIEDGHHRAVAEGILGERFLTRTQVVEMIEAAANSPQGDKHLALAVMRWAEWL